MLLAVMKNKLIYKWLLSPIVALSGTVEGIKHAVVGIL